MTLTQTTVSMFLAKHEVVQRKTHTFWEPSGRCHSSLQLGELFIRPSWTKRSSTSYMDLACQLSTKTVANRVTDGHSCAQENIGQWQNLPSFWHHAGKVHILCNRQCWFRRRHPWWKRHASHNYHGNIPEMKTKFPSWGWRMQPLSIPWNSYQTWLQQCWNAWSPRLRWFLLLARETKIDRLQKPAQQMWPGSLDEWQWGWMNFSAQGATCR